MSGNRAREVSWLGWLEALEGELASGGGAASRERVASRVLDHARLRRGDDAVDLGAGTGLLTMRAARAVGPSGRVVAVDADPGCLSRLAARAGDAGLSNVSTTLGRLGALPLVSESFDVAICRSALSYSDDLDLSLDEMRRVLRARGRFSIFEPLLGELEWEGRLGAADEDFKAMENALKRSGGPREVERSLLRDAFTAAGFEHDSLVVHNVLSMRGQPEEEVAGEYLHDLPGGLSAFNVLKRAGFAEERTVEVALAFGRAASAGEIRGRLACLFIWGLRST